MKSVLFLVAVFTSPITCGLIVDILHSVSEETTIIHQNIHDTLGPKYNSRIENTTEHQRRGIIGNVFNSIGKEIQKAKEIKKTIHNNIFNVFHANTSRYKERDREIKQGNKTSEEEKDLTEIKNLISVAKNDTSNDKDFIETISILFYIISIPLRKVENETISLPTSTVYNSTTIMDAGQNNLTGEENNAEIIESTNPQIDIRILYPISTTLTPATTAIFDEDSRIRFRYDDDSKSFKGIIQKEEPLNLTVVEEPVIDKAKFDNRRVQHFFLKKEKPQGFNDSLVFPGDSTKDQKNTKEVTTDTAKRKFKLKILPEIVFRDPNEPSQKEVAPLCAQGLKPENGTCVPSRGSFNGGCPTGTMRAKDEVCRESV